MCGPGCGGNAVTSPPVPGIAGTQPAVTDKTVYTVVYFNGTMEDVTGIDAVRQRIINPASRAAGTDENGPQGATYAPKR